MKGLTTLSEDKHLLQNPNFQFQVARLGQLAIRVDDLNTFMQVVNETVSKTLGTELCKILELIPDENKLRLISGVGWHDGIVGSATVKSNEKSQAGFTLLTDQPVIVEDLENETRFSGPDLLIDHNVKSGISVVIRGRDGIYGVIGAHSTKKLALSPDHANFLLSVSFILASVIDNQHRIQEITERESNFRELVEQASDAIFITDNNFNYIQVNSKATELTGYSKKELLSMKIPDLLTKEDIIENPIRLSNLKIGDSIVAERKLKHKNNKLIPVEINAKKLGDNKFQAIVRDLTQRKLEMEKLIQESKYNAFSHLSGGIAHDFNNLLNVIMGNISIAQAMDIEDDELKTICSNIEIATERATNITKQLLTFSRVYKPEIEIIDITKLITEVVSFTFYGSKIKPIVSTDDGTYLVEADPGQLTQVIQNLLINAEQAIESEIGEIKIQIDRNVNSALPNEREISYVHISIKDNGVGIDEEEMRQIFDPFFTTKDNGKGLGLPTSYSIVKNHGGDIQITSVVGQGTSVDLYLPKYDGNKNPTVKQILDENHKITLNGLVLVLEDEKMIQEILGKMLRMLGLEVIITADGDETISKYREILKSGKSVDYCILDLTIPNGLGGFKTFQKLKAIDPKINAIVSSGYSKENHLESYREHGFAQKLTKPYTLQELYETLMKSRLKQ